MKNLLKKVLSKSDTPKNAREIKKSINIKWNSGLFLQIGIILSLLFVLIIVETTTVLNDTAYGTVKTDTKLTEPTFFKFVVETPPINEPPAPKVNKSVIQRPKVASIVNVIKNNEPTTETPVAATNVTDAPVVTQTTINNTPEVTNPTPNLGKQNILAVENVPIFPGCEGLSTNQERKACMDAKMNQFISKSFNIDKFSSKYAGKNNRIDVQFTVSKTGQVTEILTRAKHTDLGDEAKRIITKLPLFTPGKHQNTPVDVVYSIPIILNIKD